LSVIFGALGVTGSGALQALHHLLPGTGTTSGGSSEASHYLIVKSLKKLPAVLNLSLLHPNKLTLLLDFRAVFIPSVGPHFS